MPGVPGSIPGVCVCVPRCFWGGAKAFSVGKIDLPQNYIRGPRILMFFNEF